MTIALFDTIGKTYDETRRVDKRIVDRIRALLNLPAGSLIADIGAGTGNYSIALAEAVSLARTEQPQDYSNHKRPNRYRSAL